MSLRKKILPDVPLSLPKQGPVWLGPTVDGISQTMISRYLSCHERFRILYVEGLQPIPTFRAALEFGNLWHAAEESLAEFGNKGGYTPQTGGTILRRMYDYGNTLAEQYPMQRDQVIHWIRMTAELFPVYIDYWKKHPDVVNRKPLLQEEKFCIDYTLPSGRVVKLRGKWDSVDLIDKPVWLQENKTKTSIEKDVITRQLRYDLQTMLYLIALKEWASRHSSGGLGIPTSSVIKGVRYNVVRRSSHKSSESMLKKVHEDIKDGRAEEWFARWNVEISAEDIQTFKNKTLDPVLENILDDYEWWSYCTLNRNGVCDCDAAPAHLADCPARNARRSSASLLFDHNERRIQFSEHQRRHYVMPYMGYNPLAEGGESDVDNYLFTGNRIGLQQISHTDLFPELK